MRKDVPLLLDNRGKKSGRQDGMLFIVVSVSYDPEGQAIRENSQLGRQEPVEHGVHGMWHDMACPCHVLGSLAVHTTQVPDQFCPRFTWGPEPQCTCWGCPCGTEQASALWDLRAAHTHNSVFHPMCPSQGACQQLVEAVVLLESQGLGQES